MPGVRLSYELSTGKMEKSERRSAKMKCCGQEVKVVALGEGYVRICPICRRVVYNRKDKPERGEEGRKL
jgi:hypothetical protein